MDYYLPAFLPIEEHSHERVYQLQWGLVKPGEGLRLGKWRGKTGLPRIGA